MTSTAPYSMPLHLRWADLDPNNHLRHSVYYDFAAQLRTRFLLEHGMTTRKMHELHQGPVILREEGIFRREVRLEDEVTMSLTLVSLRRDYSRFTFRHEITRPDGTLCATITIDGAWMDTVARKLTTPAEIGVEMIDRIPKAADFHWQD